MPLISRLSQPQSSDKLMPAQSSSYNGCIKPAGATSVDVRELKNRLTSYLKLVKADQEVIVTERGKPIAIIQPAGRANAPRSLEARLAAMAAAGEITLPEGPLRPRRRRFKIPGRPLSELILEDRR
jgi:prevent-host-death family protein